MARTTRAKPIRQVKRGKVKSGKQRAKPIRQVKRGKVESGKYKRSTARDRNLPAKKPGKRVSASGNVYYERRVNRSDRSKKKRI